MAGADLTGNVPVLKATSIVKSFGRIRVLNRLDISLHPGTIMVLRGDNGSGKTTLISILSFNLSPDFGIVEMPSLGSDKQKGLFRSKLGLVAHSPFLYGKLTVRENLKYFGKLHRVDYLDGTIEDCAKTLNIEDRLDDRVDTLSHGLRKRASIVRSILHNPDVLLLDEPDSGLDSKSIDTLEELIDNFVEVGKSVLVTTHGNVLSFTTEPVSAVIAAGRLTVSLQ